MRIAAILNLFLLSAPASAQELDLSAGTMQVGGSITFDIDSYTPASISNAEVTSTAGSELNVRPSFGFFVIDNLELLVAGHLSTGFGELYEGSSTTYGLNAGAAYHFPMGGLAPYVGALAGLGFVAPDEGDTTTTLYINIPAGVLIALNEWVALDLGLRINYAKSMEEGGDSFLSIPIGYLGLQAFFGGGGGGGADW